MGRVSGEFVIPEEDITHGRMIKSGDTVEQTGLTRTVRSDNGRDQALFNGHAHIGQGVQTPESERHI